MALIAPLGGRAGAEEGAGGTEGAKEGAEGAMRAEEGAEGVMRAEEGAQTALFATPAKGGRKLSPAVGAVRNIAPGADYYPTPRWATEALLDIIGSSDLGTCLEPAAGGGHMVDVLAERFRETHASDLCDPEGRGWGGRDFLSAEPPAEKYDWLITNPPFTLVERFVSRAPLFAERFAFLARLSLLEGKGRLRTLWSRMPPTQVAVFSKRVVMVKGRLPPPQVAGAIAYAWFIWGDGWREGGAPRLAWIGGDVAGEGSPALWEGDTP